jgi:tRNA1Val (adenine37-N6)-methyltransferase
LNIIQPTKGFRYNSDSFLLYDFVHALKPKGLLLDVGCGSGIIGLLIARDFEMGLVGVDIQAEMVNFAKVNAKNAAINATFFQTEIESFKSEIKFDLIVSNPPFYSGGGPQSKNDSKRIGRYSDNMPLRGFFKAVNSVMHHQGSFIFCYEAIALLELCSELALVKMKINRMQFIHKDRSSNARLVLIEAKKYLQGTLDIVPALYMCDDFLLEEVRERAGTTSING